MIQPISSRQNINFTAVNQKYLKKAREEYEFMHTISGDLIENLQFEILTKRMSKQDGYDTVKALYQYTKERYHVLLDGVLEACKLPQK